MSWCHKWHHLGRASQPHSTLQHVSPFTVASGKYGPSSVPWTPQPTFGSFWPVDVLTHPVTAVMAIYHFIYMQKDLITKQGIGISGRLHWLVQCHPVTKLEVLACLWLCKDGTCFTLKCVQQMWLTPVPWPVFLIDLWGLTTTLAYTFTMCSWSFLSIWYTSSFTKLFL